MTLETMIAAYGLPALFLGGVVEGDAVAFLGGVLAHRRLVSFEGAALAVAAGAIVGDQTLFLVGRHVIGQARIARLAGSTMGQRLLRLLDTRPDAITFGFRFVYGTRTITPLLLGARDVPHLRFLALNVIAALIWAHFVTALGYGLGAVIERFVGHLPLHQHLTLVLVVTGIAAAVLLAWRHHRRRR